MKNCVTSLTNHIMLLKALWPIMWHNIKKSLVAPTIYFNASEILSPWMAEKHKLFNAKIILSK